MYWFTVWGFGGLHFRALSTSISKNLVHKHSYHANTSYVDAANVTVPWQERSGPAQEPFPSCVPLHLAEGDEELEHAAAHAQLGLFSGRFLI